MRTSTEQGGIYNILKYHLYCTFFQKPKQGKWTWKSPDGFTKNEIDYVISNVKPVCKDDSVLNKIHTGSRHKVIGVGFKLDLQKERNKLINLPKFPTTLQLVANEKRCQGGLERELEPVDRLK